MSSSDCLPLYSSSQRTEAAFQRLKAHEACADQYPPAADGIRPAELPPALPGEPVRARFDQAVAVLQHTQAAHGEAKSRLERLIALRAEIQQAYEKKRAKGRRRTLWLLFLTALVGIGCVVIWARGRERAAATSTRPAQPTPVPAVETVAQAPRPVLVAHPPTPAPVVQQTQEPRTETVVKEPAAAAPRGVTESSTSPRVPAQPAGRPQTVPVQPEPTRPATPAAVASSTSSSPDQSGALSREVVTHLAPGALYEGQVTYGNSKYASVLVMDVPYDGAQQTAVVRVSYGAFRRFLATRELDASGSPVIVLRPLGNKPHPAGAAQYAPPDAEIPSFLRGGFPRELRLVYSDGNLQATVERPTATSYRFQFSRQLPDTVVAVDSGRDSRNIWASLGNPKIGKAVALELIARQDFERARQYLDILSEGNDPDALLALAKLLMEGKGGGMQPDRAKRLLRKAASSGSKEARELLQALPR